MPFAAVLVLVLGAGAVGLVFADRSDDGPAAAVRGYLGDVRAAHYNDAYDRLCDSVRSRRTAAEYGVIMRAFDGVRGSVAEFSVLGVQTASPTAAQTVQVDVQRGRGTERESYEVSRESGEYCLLTPGAPFAGGESGDVPGQQPGPYRDRSTPRPPTEPGDSFGGEPARPA